MLKPPPTPQWATQVGGVVRGEAKRRLSATVTLQCELSGRWELSGRRDQNLASAALILQVQLQESNVRVLHT